MSTQARDATSMDAFVNNLPTLLRAHLHLHPHQISLAHFAHHVSRLLACLPVCFYDSTNVAPYISHVSQQALYPYDYYDDQKIWNMCDEWKAFKRSYGTCLYWV